MKGYFRNLSFILALIIPCVSLFSCSAPLEAKISAAIIPETQEPATAPSVEQAAPETESAEHRQELPEAEKKTDEPASKPQPSVEPATEEKVPALVEPPVVEEKEEAQPEPENLCTLTVRCDTVLKNAAKLNPDKAGLIPSDGLIFRGEGISFNHGESVFNVLLREMKRNKIHLEFVNTPLYSSAYIEGINNLYEFDCGELSGWMYTVNGEFPGRGCSQYTLKPEDVIEWVYTCDLGRDIGGSGAPLGGAGETTGGEG